jgi:ferritin-like metal-binding protein YciE
LEARAFVSEKTLATLDQCFKLIGEKPVKFTGRIQEIFVEDFRKQFAEIEGPVARKLFILAKLNHLTHLRIGEYVALVAAADVSGHYGVGVLLESCLADRLAFVERTRRLIRNVIETRVAERKGAERAA